MVSEGMDLYIAGFWFVLAALTVLAWTWRDRDATGRTRPGQPELAVAALFWAAALLTVLVRPSLATRFSLIEHALLIVDVGLLAGLTWVAVRSGKSWILCAAALHLISSVAHLARLVTPNMWRLGYQVMEEASSYPVLLLLAWGVVTHRLAEKRTKSSSTSSEARMGRSRTRAS